MHSKITYLTYFNDNTLSWCITIAIDICQKKSYEITADPKLLDKIEVAGNIITADAMYFQKPIINKIRQKEEIMSLN